MAHPKHQDVRERFRFCCGYCGVCEENAGGELSVDHYQPISAGGDDSDENLIYACVRCNLYKGFFWPGAGDLAAGLRLLHPLHDKAAAHLQERFDGTLEGLTVTGRFHIATLQLDRPQLIAFRRQKRSTTNQNLQNRMLMTVIEI